jgi:HEAT repeat protein
MKKNGTILTGLALLSAFICIFTNTPQVLAQVRQDTIKTKKIIKAKTKAIESNDNQYQDKVSADEINNRQIEERKKNIESKRKEDIQPIIRDLQHPDQDRRQVTLDGIKMYPDPRLIEPLITVLNKDEIAVVRKDAAFALSSIAIFYPENKAQILNVLDSALKDNSINVKLGVANVLIELGYPDNAIEILVTIFKMEYDIFNQPLEKWIKNEICRADLPYDKQIELAEKAKSGVQDTALRLLIKIGNDRVVNELNNCLSSSDASIIIKAKNALDQLKTNRK